MLKYTYFLVLLSLALLLPVRKIQAQQYDLLIKNGHVIDPKNNIDSNRDVAVKNGKIAEVSANIPASQSKKVIDATGFFVTPGLIDTHTHVFVGGTPQSFADGSYSVSPDDFTLRSGVTTVVDAGDAGWTNFPVFKKNVIDHSKTRILEYLNVFSSGLVGYPEQENVQDINPQMIEGMIEKYPDTIVGVCVGHYRGDKWEPFEIAGETAHKSGVPLFVECHLPQLSLEGQLERMRPGDIITHAYEEIDERAPVVDDQNRVRPYVLAAQKRGILFDLGHGGAGFWFSQAIPAMQQGLLLNSFGTDLHRFSMNAGMKNFANVMSKFLNLGMSIQDVIKRATWLPAQSITRPDLGNLSPGSVADVAVLSIQHGKFGFVDAGGNRIDGDRKLQAELTLRAGNIVWDLNGISAKKLDRSAYNSQVQ